jgi:sugar phosphate isomerase/epimerase
MITKPKIKLPAGFFSHQVAYGLQFSLDLLDARLRHDRECGYVGQVIVPATFPPDITAEGIIGVAKDNKMEVITCGFMPGDGPDPMSTRGYQAACEKFIGQINLAEALANAGVSRRLMVGPWQTWHGKESPEVSTNPELLERWMDFANHQAGNRSITLAAEGLNIVEQPGIVGDNDPFHQIMAFAKTHRRIRLHMDMGHLFSRLGLAGSLKFIRKFADYIAFFEFGNAGRYPLDIPGVIDVSQFYEVIKELPADVRFGVEPFDPDGTIKPLGLQKLCPTTVPGPEALMRDARFLIDEGVMVHGGLSC